MSPMNQSGKKIAIPNNIYTALLAASFGSLLATICFVAYKCFTQYGTLINIP